MINLDLIYYKYYVKEKAKAIAPSRIPFYDLTIVMGGTLDYEINGEKITLYENDCILIPPQSLRKRFGGREETEYVSFNFISDDEIPLPLVSRNCAGNEIKHVVFACNCYKDPYAPQCKEIFRSLASAVTEALAFALDNAKYNEITNGVIAFVRKNYKNKLSLREICEAVGYSPTYCDGVFKKDTDRSIIDFLLETRVSKAKELLIENTFSLTEIAEKTGFSDYNYFSRLFKKRTGVSPVRFRKKFNS